MIGRFDTEVLSDIIARSGNARRELEESITNDINKLSSVIMREELKTKLVDVLSTYDGASRSIFSVVNQMSDIIPAQNWYVENDSAHIQDHDKIIEESTSIYIIGEKGIALYNRLQDIAKELNSINELSQKYNIVAVGNPPVMRGFINIDEKKIYNINGLLTANLVKEVYK